MESQLSVDGESPLSDFIMALATSFEAIGELESMFAKMADVAPEEIRGDVESVHEAIGGQIEMLESSGGDPLAALFGSLMSGMINAAAERRVNQFIFDNCDNPFSD